MYPPLYSSAPLSQFTALFQMSVLFVVLLISKHKCEHKILSTTKCLFADYLATNEDDTPNNTVNNSVERVANVVGDCDIFLTTL